MITTDDADSIETWLTVLRTEVAPAPARARDGIGARLAQAGLIGAASGAALVAGGWAWRSVMASKAFAVVVTLPLGMLVGAAGHAWLARPAAVAVAPVVVPKVVAPALAASPPVPEPQLDVADPPAEVVPARAGSAKARALPSAAASSPEVQGLERELLLLEQARTRLSENDPAATLQLLQRHRSAYPSSTLEQEREALTIRALVASGRGEEAQRLAAAFVQRFPGSVMRPAVERAVGTIP